MHHSTIVIRHSRGYSAERIGLRAKSTEENSRFTGFDAAKCFSEPNPKSLAQTVFDMSVLAPTILFAILICRYFIEAVALSEV